MLTKSRRWYWRTAWGTAHIPGNAPARRTAVLVVAAASATHCGWTGAAFAPFHVALSTPQCTTAATATAPRRQPSGRNRQWLP